MILSFGPDPSLALPNLVVACAATVAYLAALVPGADQRGWPARALLVGWLLHAAALALDISGYGDLARGPRLGFAPVLSLTLWLVLAVHEVESRLVPLPAVRRAFAGAGTAVLMLGLLYPGEPHALTGSALAPLHWVLGVGSYGLFGAAVLHATMLDSAERRLRQRAGPPVGPLGIPLLRLERLTFRFVEAGFVVLTAAVILGAASATRWRWDHKTVLSLIGWAVFAGLLLGRHLRGWRGLRATRWLYAGTLILLLAYVGSRFVFEAVLGRAPG
jgi:ABC-type uncharacterized transport system permease subunit